MDQFIRNLEARISLILTALVGLLVAVLIGFTVGSENFVPVIVLFGVAGVVALVLCMRHHIWLLIPLCWYLTGGPGALPIPFSIRDLAVLLAFIVFVSFITLHRTGIRATTNLLDIILFVNLGYLATVYVRNPVGVAAFGASMVGGKPYFEVVLAIFAYLIFTRTLASPKIAQRLPLLIAVPQVIVSLLALAAFFVPSVGTVVSMVYTGVSAPDDSAPDDPGDTGEGVGRLFDLANGAKAGALALLSYCSPMSLVSVARPLRALAFFACFVAMGFAGFRNGIFYLGFLFAFAALVRHGMGRMLQIVAVLVVVAGLLVGLQTVGIHLPVTVQRSLSFLPGDWDRVAKSDAEGSTEWRMYMWQQALGGNEFIKNKILGDGFGFSAFELQFMGEQNGYIGLERQESFMVQGAFHSGPISTIRFVGVVGLALYLILMGAIAWRAWRLLKVTVGTPYFPLVMSLALPAIYEPFAFLFIFGAYDSGLPTTIFFCGMIRLAENSWRHWKGSTPEPAPERNLAEVSV